MESIYHALGNDGVAGNHGVVYGIFKCDAAVAVRLISDTAQHLERQLIMPAERAGNLGRYRSEDPRDDRSCHGD
jgi:hypothetical protein